MMKSTKHYTVALAFAYRKICNTLLNFIADLHGFVDFLRCLQNSNILYIMRLLYDLGFAD